MTGFYWLPFRDSSWHADTINRGDFYHDRILPFMDGGDASGPNLKAGRWSDIAEGDSLWLPVHGHKYSTEKVSWDVGGLLTTWGADEFADRILEKLLWRYANVHHYHLLACFGANNITAFARSFGERLAEAMTRRGFQGTLTAYKGATGMKANRGHQIGTSRMKAAPYFLMHRGPGAPSHVSIATKDAAKTWPLGARAKLR